MSEKPKICFVEAAAYAVLDPDINESSTGGESVQHSLLARAFASRGWDVSMVSRDFGQEDGVVVDGIRVWKTNRQGAGLPYLRFFYPRLYKAWRALKKADADIYFQSCAGLMTGVLARFVSGRDKHMVFRIAHDTDCIPGQQLIKLDRDRHIYDYGLRRADLVSAQSRTQAELLEKNYGLKSFEVDMAAEIPEAPDERKRDIDILWVNNFRDFKRPELVLDIAKNMPDASITMIGGRMKNHESLYDQVKDKATHLGNIDFVGGVPYSEVNAYFARAKLFLNTSDSEGFPNSFLQAWVRGVPVVSYFDPDNLIETKGLGCSAGSQDDFSEVLEPMLRDDEHRREIGRRARQFVIDRYSPNAIAAEYEDLFFRHLGVEPPDG